MTDERELDTRAAMFHESQITQPAASESALNDLLYCDGCEHLSPTEAEQDEYRFSKPPHKCKKYGYTLHHYGEHPRLPRPRECKY